MEMQEKIKQFVDNSNLEIASVELGDDFIEAARCHEIIMNGSISRSLANYYENNKSKLHPFTIARFEAGKSVSTNSYIDAI